MKKKRNFLIDSYREITIAAKGILKVKDVFLALQFIAIIIGACSHFKTCTQLKNVEKQSDKYQHQRDSLKVENINLKY